MLFSDRLQVGEVVSTIPSMLLLGSINALVHVDVRVRISFHVNSIFMFFIFVVLVLSQPLDSMLRLSHTRTSSSRSGTWVDRPASAHTGVATTPTHKL